MGNAIIKHMNLKKRVIDLGGGGNINLQDFNVDISKANPNDFFATGLSDEWYFQQIGTYEFTGTGTGVCGTTGYGDISVEVSSEYKEIQNGVLKWSATKRGSGTTDYSGAANCHGTGNKTSTPSKVYYIENLNKQCISLGSGQTWNIKNLYPNLWNKVNINNFVVRNFYNPYTYWSNTLCNSCTRVTCYIEKSYVDGVLSWSYYNSVRGSVSMQNIGDVYMILPSYLYG